VSKGGTSSRALHGFERGSLGSSGGASRMEPVPDVPGRVIGQGSLSVLERWCDNGGEYRIVHLSDGLAVVQLCTCSGEPVDRLVASDPQLLRYLSETGDNGAERWETLDDRRR
jgi:hypothetical protein